MRWLPDKGGRERKQKEKRRSSTDKGRKPSRGRESRKGERVLQHTFHLRCLSSMEINKSVFRFLKLRPNLYGRTNVFSLYTMGNRKFGEGEGRRAKKNFSKVSFSNVTIVLQPQWKMG